MRPVAPFIWAVLLAGCEADLGACPPDSMDDQVRGRIAVENECAYCHGSDLKGRDRSAAPSGLNWDDPRAVREWRRTMWTWIDGESMPPPNVGPLAAREKEYIRVWLACGAPDVPLPLCGNGVVEVDEGCDDANTTPGDGCSRCTLEP